MLHAESEYTASMITQDNNTVQGAFDCRGTTRESQEERSDAPASDDQPEGIMDLVQNLQRALGIEDSTPFCSEERRRNNRA